MSLVHRRCVSAGAVGALALFVGCFNPDENPLLSTDTEGPDASTGDPSTDPTSGTAGTTTDTPTTTDPSADTTAAEECSANNAIDTSCPEATPYCAGGMCVDCTGLTCADVDDDTPVCNADGRCVECNDDDVSVCELDQTACVDNECVVCTDNAQCPSGICQSDGECLLEAVTVTGVAFDYSTIDRTPLGEVTVQITNVIDAPTAEPTAADGVYQLDGLVPGTLLDLQPLWDQNASVVVPATLSSRVSVSVTNDQPIEFDVPVVPYEWMAQVAFECGLFPTLEDAIGENAVNPYFIQRSTVFGQLVDSEGNGVATVSKAAIRARIGEWANFQDNLLDTDGSPTEVCFLDEDAVSGTYVGTGDDVSNDSGRFVMFRLRNNTGFGQGTLSVSVSGFDEVYTTLPSSGNIGVVELLRNDQPIIRDFAIDIYPLFDTYGCTGTGCHSNGGPTPAIRNGYTADWSLTPREVWEQLVGPGTECPNPADPVRICTDDPANSLFITRPLTEPVGETDPHPVDIFPSIEDPQVQVMLEWIEQGAQPPAAISFVEDIYPLFEKHGCIACHTAGGPPEAVSMGFNADWSLDPQSVYDLLVGPGITCPDAANPVRICTEDPLNSKLVSFPLTDAPGMPDDHPVNAFATTEHPDMQKIIQWIAQGADFENECAHDECSAGEPLVPGCSPCATAVCDQYPFCCNSNWDAACVNAANNTPACGC